jgi:hypothetical protein
VEEIYSRARDGACHREIQLLLLLHRKSRRTKYPSVNCRFDWSVHDRHREKSTVAPIDLPFLIPTITLGMTVARALAVAHDMALAHVVIVAHAVMKVPALMVARAVIVAHALTVDRDGTLAHALTVDRAVMMDRSFFLCGSEALNFFLGHLGHALFEQETRVEKDGPCGVPNLLPLASG